MLTSLRKSVAILFSARFLDQISGKSCLQDVAVAFFVQDSQKLSGKLHNLPHINAGLYAGFFAHIDDILGADVAGRVRNEGAAAQACEGGVKLMVTGGGMEGIGKDHFFSSEKLTTLLTLFKYEGEFQAALDMMQAIFNVGGKGHSCGIYSWDDSHIDRLASCAPVSRIMVRQPNNRGNSGSAFNGMPPTSSMSCGTWGGNIITENISLRQYMNITWVARPILEDMPESRVLLGEFYHSDFDTEKKTVIDD